MIIGHPPLSSSSLSSAAAQCQYPQCSWPPPTTSSGSYGHVQPWPWKMAGARKWLRARRRKRASLICESAASPYDILGVPRTASEKEIKQAYRKLALKYHPDVNKAPDAQQKFMAIKNAYQTLVDTKSRAKYDRSSGSADEFNWGFPRSKEEEEDFYGIGDFFRDLQADFEKAAASGKPKSLWEELAEIGEEFVEFLEKELTNIVDTNQSVWGKEDIYGFKSKEERGSSNATDKNDKSNAEESGKKSENEIEDLLTKLKEELGL